MPLDPKAYSELGDVTEHYRNAAADELKPLFDEFKVTNVRTGELTDSLGGLLERDPVQLIRVMRNGSMMFGPGKFALPRDVFCFLRGVYVARALAAQGVV